MSQETILVVEDDPDIIELLQYSLEREGYTVLVAQEGARGLSEAKRTRPAAILLDLMLPKMDGLEVCRQLRQDAKTSEIPVIMVTAKGEDSDVVIGLGVGADDYVSKPFSPRELVARLRAVIRRQQSKAGREVTRIEMGDVVLDRERFEVSVKGNHIAMTLAEFRLLWALGSHPGRVYTRDSLVDSITNGEAMIVERNVDVHVSSIRRKLGEGVDFIGTVRGVGYKWKDN